MKNALFIIVAIIAWLGTPILIIWEWSIWWDHGYTFWVFLSLFTGIGWIPAWFMGVWDLLSINPLVGIIYLSVVGYYFYLFQDD